MVDAQVASLILNELVMRVSREISPKKWIDRYLQDHMDDIITLNNWSYQARQGTRLVAHHQQYVSKSFETTMPLCSETNVWKTFSLLSYSSSSSVDCLSQQQSDRRVLGNHIISEPSFQVLSVDAHFYNEGDGLHQVYGEIYVGDSNRLYTLYKRDQCDAETITSANKTITLQSGLIPMSKCDMYIDLKGRWASGSVLAKSCITLESPGQPQEEIRRVIIEGECGFLLVTYMAMSCGVVVDVKTTLMVYSDDDSDDEKCTKSDVDVCGFVYAFYDKLHEMNSINLGQELWGDDTCMKLFHKLPNQPLQLSYSANLSSCRLAIPAHSSLIIKAGLFECGSGRIIAYGSSEIKPLIGYHHNYDIDGEDAYIELKLEWYKNFSLEDTIRVTSGRQNGFGLQNSYSKKMWEKLDDRPILFKDLSDRTSLRGSQIVEVFSVSMGHHQSDVFSIYGKIAYCVINGETNLFSRDWDDGQLIYSGSNTLSLQSPSKPMCYEPSFNILVDLKDVNDVVAIEGEATPPVGIYLELSAWYDKFLCSVVGGKGAYVAIHYIVFSQAILGRLKMVLSCKNHCETKVYGRLVATYDKFDYPTRYDLNHYRNVIFERSKDSALLCERRPEDDDDVWSFELPLSKALIPLPIDSSLTIDVELFGSSNSSYRRVEELIGILKFKIDGSPVSSKTIVGQDFEINISVSWGQVWELE